MAPPVEWSPEAVEDVEAFSVRCSARHRERQLGTGYGFGIFVEGHFAGEINVSSVQRGPFQSAYVGYWIDEARAGNSYVAEALVVVAKHCFEELRLHRLQIAIIPRNRASRRVVEKLDIREEGTALRYLEINGTICAMRSRSTMVSLACTCTFERSALSRVAAW